MDFVARLHVRAPDFIEPSLNAGYPPLIVRYLRFAPVLLQQDGVTPQRPLQPDPRLLQAAAELGQQVDFIAIPSNGPYLFREQIERAAGRPLLDMVGLALDEVRQRGWARAGVLGLGPPTVYTERMDELKLNYETVAERSQIPLDRAIFAVMEGQVGERERAAAWAAVHELQRGGVDGVILGCTEIPLLLNADNEPDLLDPMDLLVDECLRRALE